MREEKQAHIPVLLNEVKKYLQPEKAGIYVDATFGAGSYSKEILDANPQNQLFSFDRDTRVQEFANNLSKKYSDRFHFINNKFSNIKEEMSEKYNITKIDGIVFDLGISSMQVDEGERGFSFLKSAKLNMQMGINNISAYDIINFYSEKDLANIIYRFGDEKESRKIAKKIIEIRTEKPIETTLELANLIEEIKKNRKPTKIHSATKTFQALRIYVNQELEELKDILAKTYDLLNQGGRLVVVSFHSLEDKIIKNFLRDNSRNTENNRYLPETLSKNNKLFEILTKKAIKPSFDEVSKNVRSRSAKLRAGKKI